ncbi:MAG: EI24 domain-containing protein [Myxococcales bacterium]|nr:EI24 domain-containing protein [Myxococcales bacterium]
MLATTRARFMAGLHAAGSGLRLSSGSAELRRTYLQLVGVLFVVGAVVDVAGIWAVLHYTAIGEDASWWLAAGLWVARVLGVVAVLLVAPLLALTVVNAIFPFLGERVFMAAMRVVSPARAEQLAASPGLPLVTSVLIELRRIASLLLRSVAIFLLSLIPAVGQVLGPVLQGYTSARGLAWELLDPYLDKLQLGYAEQRSFVAAHRPALVGFGLPLSLLMAIPVVGPLLFGLAQGAAAELVAEVIEAPRSPGA